MSFLIGNIQIIDLEVDLGNLFVQINQLSGQVFPCLLSSRLRKQRVRFSSSETGLRQSHAIQTERSYPGSGHSVNSNITILKLKSQGTHFMLSSTTKLYCKQKSTRRQCPSVALDRNQTLIQTLNQTSAWNTFARETSSEITLISSISCLILVLSFSTLHRQQNYPSVLREG